jgi:hypothetical protein
MKKFDLGKNYNVLHCGTEGVNHKFLTFDISI